MLFELAKARINESELDRVDSNKFAGIYGRVSTLKLFSYFTDVFIGSLQILISYQHEI